MKHIPRFFIEKQIKEDFFISKNDSIYHHINNVLRLKPDNQVILLNNTGKEYIYYIESINKEQIKLKLHEIKNGYELPIKITLVQSILKGNKMDFVFQKACELGVSKIIPLITEYTNVSLDDKKIKHKLKRWETIVKEASSQSERTKIPEISYPLELSEIVNLTKDDDLILICHPRINIYLKNVLTHSIFNSIVIFCGPEGGFSEKDLRQIPSSYKFVKLTDTILRAETSGIVAISMILYHFLKK